MFNYPKTEWMLASLVSMHFNCPQRIQHHRTIIAINNITSYGLSTISNNILEDHIELFYIIYIIVIPYSLTVQLTLLG